MSTYVLYGFGALLLVLLLGSCARKSAAANVAASPQAPADSTTGVNIEELDGFLRHWDEFAQGKEGPDYIRVHGQDFYDAVVRGLKQGNKQVVPRIAMYFFVQVFFFLPERSKLYPLLHELSGGELVAVEVKGEEEKVLSSAEIWHWWKEKGAAYPTYDLLERWLARPFAREKVIPQYERFDRSAK